MEYVNLGSTGLKVSRICLGTMTYGLKKWREWVLEDAEARPFYRHAIEAGINFFDTADIYSQKTNYFAQKLYYRPSDFTIVERLTEIAKKRSTKLADSFSLDSAEARSQFTHHWRQQNASFGSNDRGAQYPLG
jgi:predicted aldo/keto reductase-like oxidoreductase